MWWNTHYGGLILHQLYSSCPCKWYNFLFLVNHCSMSNDCKMSETPLSWDVSISDTPPQPCPLSWPLNKGVLAIFLQVYNVKISLNAGWSNVAQLGNVLHENFGPNDPIVWDRDCPLCRLEKSHLYPYFIKVGESENPKQLLRQLSYRQTVPSQDCGDGGNVVDRNDSSRTYSIIQRIAYRVAGREPPYVMQKGRSKSIWTLWISLSKGTGYFEEAGLTSKELWVLPDIPKNKNLHHKSSSEKYQWILLLSHWGYFEIFEIASTAQK